MDVLVMENIYYNKTISEQFDLKGSLRNRMVEASSGKNTVLLDENLVQSKSVQCVEVQPFNMSTPPPPLPFGWLY